ncbi:ubiquinone biosynthesis protein UbiH [Diaphorobacter aerolatus]|uniref:Ubiquinone biosynthesis protein UbiH n=1 Tax=Diaphorobacter aerolatus TaxID=1288495 RepID=A0A7H0GG63_9BURK|nr:ubiquinone biosynthesis protein UbiH [Diaphorobacter aerolatus]QNP47279.1 ubiquinone biosynthesis protein UbiH [Diaphorobacter aerolatus]
MAAFLHYALGFPTFIFGVLLLSMLLYWVIAIFGLVEIDSMDHWALFDGSHHAHAHAHAHSHGAEDSIGALAGLLLKVGLGGIPLTVILTVLFLLSWLISYTLAHFVPMPEGWTLLNIAIGSALFAAALVLGFIATVIVLRPLRKAIAMVAPPEEAKVLLGRTGLVRSAVVNATQGYGSVEDGGGGLNVQMRSADREFPRGTQIVLIEHMKDHNAWRVVSKAEFDGLELPPR